MRIFATAVVLLALPVAAHAQASGQQGPGQFRGAIVSVADEAITVKAPNGAMVAVKMAKGWTAATARPVAAEAIQPGDFIASANLDTGPNTGKAIEMRILEASYRPEFGTHAITQLVNTSITHGTVQTSQKTADGQDVLVIYDGGSRRILVPQGVKVMAFDIRDRSQVKPGVNVSGVTRKDASGADVGSRVVFEP